MEKVLTKFLATSGIYFLIYIDNPMQIRGKHKITIFLKVTKTGTKHIVISNIDDVFGFSISKHNYLLLPS